MTTTQIPQTKGQRMRLLRKSLKLTQKEFGKQLGIVQNNISAMEKNDRPIGQRLTKDILATFAINPRWWEKGEGKMFLKNTPVKIMVLAESAEAIELIKAVKGVQSVNIVN